MAFRRQLLNKALGGGRGEAKAKIADYHHCYRRSSISTTTVPSSSAGGGGIDEPLLPPFDYEPQSYNGPLADQVFQKRNKFLGPSLFHYYKNPVISVEGRMQYLFDENGRRYLDAFAGIVTVSRGHCYPDVLNAIVERAGFYSLPQPFTYTTQ